MDEKTYKIVQKYQDFNSLTTANKFNPKVSLDIIYGLPKNTLVTVEYLNLQGRVLYSHKECILANIHNMSKLSKGMYILKLRTSNRILLRKVVIK